MIDLGNAGMVDLDKLPLADNLRLIRLLSLSAESKLKTKWDDLEETRDLTTPDGQLVLKLIGKVSNDLAALVGRVIILEKHAPALELIDEISLKLKEVPF